jgi:hypothetical protein
MMAASTETVFFSSDAREPWCYIPRSWIRAGTVFIAGDVRFYRFERQEATGWWCEHVAPDSVGSPAMVRRARSALLEYQLAATALGESSDRESRAFTMAQARADDQREELMQLLNERPLPDSDRSSARGEAFIAAAGGAALVTLFVMTFHRQRWVLDGSDTRVPWVRTVLIIGGIAVVLLVLAAVHIFVPISTRRRLRLPGRRTKR